jgi:hypothetical protein
MSCRCTTEGLYQPSEDGGAYQRSVCAGATATTCVGAGPGLGCVGSGYRWRPDANLRIRISAHWPDALH